MGPYVKTFGGSDEIDDAWIITDGDGSVIAILDTEMMADVMMDRLVNGGTPPPDFEEGVLHGEEEEEDEPEPRVDSGG